MSYGSHRGEWFMDLDAGQRMWNMTPTPPMGSKRLESDDDFRKRILYVAGDSRDLQVARGPQLDELGARVGLTRRLV